MYLSIVHPLYAMHLNLCQIKKTLRDVLATSVPKLLLLISSSGHIFSRQKKGKTPAVKVLQICFSCCATA